jgi:hypothetical protein
MTSDLRVDLAESACYQGQMNARLFHWTEVPVQHLKMIKLKKETFQFRHADVVNCQYSNYKQSTEFIRQQTRNTQLMHNATSFRRRMILRKTPLRNPSTQRGLRQLFRGFISGYGPGSGLNEVQISPPISASSSFGSKKTTSLDSILFKL